MDNRLLYILYFKFFLSNELHKIVWVLLMFFIYQLCMLFIAPQVHIHDTQQHERHCKSSKK